MLNSKPNNLLKLLYCCAWKSWAMKTGLFSNPEQWVKIIAEG